jgi:hypothetical protein
MATISPYRKKSGIVRTKRTHKRRRRENSSQQAFELICSMFQAEFWLGINSYVPYPFRYRIARMTLLASYFGYDYGAIPSDRPVSTRHLSLVTSH